MNYKKLKVSDIKVYISQSTIDIIERHKQNKRATPESGGILLGQVRGNEIFILKASTPNKFDKSSRNSFSCNKDAAQIIIDYEFLNSDKKTIYLGEWHTHPENFPTPSGIDQKMIKDQYFKNKLNEPFLMLLIQGRKERYFSIFDGKKIMKLN